MSYAIDTRYANSRGCSPNNLEFQRDRATGNDFPKFLLFLSPPSPSSFERSMIIAGEWLSFISVVADPVAVPRKSSN